ncbi:DHA2 family efflux MFS transporter permease subunit [Pseudoclavibacter chungangensis]|uniref:DHA2 family efflux MFS transporter permease subunit n=1 Tax=Pseudoclavibacter chungangensis TaxID=587635 RepID=A0A7J5BM84_9MICO|nr:DHA2 family efflux MFS transporter permease subunit [Pseudoclavibacter chungangensis]KAB1652158.1 DHA2 family efflux MFS transporter permease subunit [Pseudoclavibacter chungangensis]NYJ68685.1 EmrB/QacA subfamily drug resistance transporter [Pseudoclavibacter chungangensis]
MTDSESVDAIRPAASTPSAAATPTPPTPSPWPGLWALVIGSFMLLVDTTIVSVANPAIKAALDPATTNLDNVVWVTSAYLLAYAVPLLITGRLGDRFGPKPIYLIGLAVFTLSSLWCGLSGSLGELIAARAVQGLGAALMTPQTMAVITRTFPPRTRGTAMGLWGATSGVATLVGPLAGGLLVDALGWEWIFFVNVPVGIIGFVLAMIYVPKLETHAHRFDYLGVVLSALALFGIVFGLQEAEKFSWGVIWGPISVWGLIIAGIVVLGLFVLQQWKTRSEPLVPLGLFRDRNFSLANIGIALVGFTVTGMTLPLMFFTQLARGLTPTQSALLMVPMAVIGGVLAPFTGRLLNRVDARFLVIPGLFLVSLSLFWYASLMNTSTPIWMYLLPSALMGFGNAGMWAPLSMTATRNLTPRDAGSGASIYNTSRTVGSVIGSASIAALMQSRLTANLPQAADSTSGLGTGQLPPVVVDGFATAMSQTVLLPAIAILVGFVVVWFFERPKDLPTSGRADRHVRTGATPD